MYLASGVPQGSVLGSIIFLIYVNHVASSVGCGWKTFADDFKLYLNFPRSACILMLQCMMSLQNNLNMVCAIAKWWNLKLNINNSVVMRFSAHQAIEYLFNYNLDGNVLDFI